MLRSILVPLDGSDSSVKAGRVALELAVRHKAHVEALGIVNSAWIQRPEPVPLGGSAFKTETGNRRIESVSHRVDGALDALRVQGERAGVSSLQVREVDGDPADILQSEATAHDLIVVGRASLFDSDVDLYDFPMAVDRIIRNEPRPVLLVPDGPHQDAGALVGGPILVGFDGSVAASRTLHMFALLGFAMDQPIHVLTVDNDSTEEAGATAGRACSLLRHHGASQVHAIGLGDREAGTPAEAILGTAKALGARMIVMGAYGHSGIRELFGSSTRTILRACPTPLFLHH